MPKDNDNGNNTVNEPLVNEKYATQMVYMFQILKGVASRNL